MYMENLRLCGPLTRLKAKRITAPVRWAEWRSAESAVGRFRWRAPPFSRVSLRARRLSARAWGNTGLLQGKSDIRRWESPSIFASDAGNIRPYPPDESLVIREIPGNPPVARPYVFRRLQDPPCDLITATPGALSGYFPGAGWPIAPFHPPGGYRFAPGILGGALAISTDAKCNSY